MRYSNDNAHPKPNLAGTKTIGVSTPSEELSGADTDKFANPFTGDSFDYPLMDTQTQDRERDD
jgi:hypothetical protein